MKNSKFFSVQAKDFAKGLALSVVFFVLTSLYSSLQDGVLPTLEEWKRIGINTLTVGIAYILKNLFTNSKDQFMRGEEKPI